MFKLDLRNLNREIEGVKFENQNSERGHLSNNKKKAIIDAKNLLKKVGLDKRLDHFPSELSGGESQRVAISRALINSPDIILADEPTGNLDSINSKKIIELLKKVNSEYGVTVIYVTHNKEFASIARTSFTIKDGKCIKTR